MNVALNVFKFFIPPSAKKKKLEELFYLTADAFQCKVPEIKRLTYSETLEKYAAFTRDEAQRSIESGDDLAALKTRLYANALALGEKLRKRYGIKTLSDAMAMSRILYRILGIDFQGNRQGEVVIRRCFFSDIYSSQICEVISALDEGVAAGLSGGGVFAFDQRITQGKSCCKAWIRFEENME